MKQEYRNFTGGGGKGGGDSRTPCRYWNPEVLKSSLEKGKVLGFPLQYRLKTLPSNTRDVCLILGHGAKIPHASSQKTRTWTTKAMLQQIH